MIIAVIAAAILVGCGILLIKYGVTALIAGLTMLAIVCGLKKD